MLYNDDAGRKRRVPHYELDLSLIYVETLEVHVSILRLTIGLSWSGELYNGIS
jgi:hypothetical protein